MILVSLSLFISAFFLAVSDLGKVNAKRAANFVNNHTVHCTHSHTIRIHSSTRVSRARSLRAKRQMKKSRDKIVARISKKRAHTHIGKEHKGHQKDMQENVAVAIPSSQNILSSETTKLVEPMKMRESKRAKTSPHRHRRILGPITSSEQSEKVRD